MNEGIATITVEEFQEQFLRLHAELTSFLFRLTANRQDAEDLAHDAYIKALRSLKGFAGRSTLKTWLFAIAANLAKDHFRVQQRWQEDTQDRCREDTQASPEKVNRMREIVDASPAEKYEFKEHIDYCFTCIAKTLELEQQLVLMLKEIYGFKVAEIMEILRLSEGQVKYALTTARQTMSDIYERRCELINKEGICFQCSEVNDFIDPQQRGQKRLTQLQLHRESQNGTSKERLFELRMELIKGIDPSHVPGTDLHAYLLELMPDSVR